MKNSWIKKERKSLQGFSLVEVLLAITIFAIFSTGVFYLLLDTIQRDTRISTNTEALLYAQEGIEVVRNIGSKNFLLLANGDHGLDLTNGAWEFVTAPEYIDNFYERTVSIEDVYRNEEGDIDEEEGTYYNPDIKKITSEIAWYQGGIIPRSMTLTSYISNWKGDDWIQTTCAEFNEGTFEDTEVEIIPGPPDDNCGLKLTTIEQESDFFSTVNLGKHANDVDVEGDYAYLAVYDFWNGLAIIDISNAEAPNLTDEVYVWNKGRYVVKKGNYVYMGIKSWGFSHAIVNVSDPYDASLVTSLIFGDYGNQPAVSEDGNYLYTAIDSRRWGLWVWDIGWWTWPVPVLIDSADFNDEVHVIELDEGYAYVGSDDDQYGLRVMDISNPYDVNQVASLNVGEEVNAITITGSIAFVGTEDRQDSLQVVDISDPEHPSIVTSLDVGGEIQDLSITGNYLYAAVDEEHAGLAAINISNPYNPSFIYNLDIQGKGTGIDSDEGHIYISTTTHNKGLIIVGTTQLSSEIGGTFISNYFDTVSNDTQYNFIGWDYTEVPGGSVKFQIRTADSVENLEFATWAGPDGTNAAFYENSRTIITLDPGRSGSRYFQFKAFMESDGLTSPLLESVRINYTP